jgi:hypothetical protein
MVWQSSVKTLWRIRSAIAKEQSLQERQSVSESIADVGRSPHEVLGKIRAGMLFLSSHMGIRIRKTQWDGLTTSSFLTYRVLVVWIGDGGTVIITQNENDNNYVQKPVQPGLIVI